MIGHTAVRESMDRRVFERRMFQVAALLFPLTILAGFARTYYLRGLFDVPALPSLLVHLHGVLMTAWVGLFVTQVGLISSKRIRVHQRLGYAGIGLGALIIPVGFVTALRAAKYGSTSTPPGASPLGFLIVPLLDLVMFTIFFGAAIYYRKKPAEHKRLMLLTAINFLPPALGRMPIASLQALGPLWFFGFPTALALICLGLDRWHSGKVNRIFVVGIVLLVAAYIARLALMTNSTWLALAARLTRLV
jgi:hypothetical protein